MKKEIIIDGKTYKLVEENTSNEAKFKSGQWVKVIRDGSNASDFNSLINVYGKGVYNTPKWEACVYRIDGNIKLWSGSCSMKSFCYPLTLQGDYAGYVYEDALQLATESEIEDHLISEAKRRYPIGTRFISFDDHDRERVVKPYHNEKNVTWYLSGDCVRSLNGICNYGTDDCSNPSVYDNGVWAEIIKEQPIKIGNHEVKKSNDGIEIGCEHFDNSELRTLNRLFNICRSENLVLRITGDDLMVNVRDGENLSTTSYKDLFKGTEIGNVKF